MAYGQNQIFVAFPQPGTSNLPFPSGDKPAFVPVTCTVTGGEFTLTDSYATAIAANVLVVEEALVLLSTAIGASTVPGSLLGTLSAVNDSLLRMADKKEAMAKFLSDISIATGSVACSKSTYVAAKSIMATNQIQTNNFYQAAAPDKPIMPPLNDQIKTSITNGALLESISRTSSAVISFVSSSVATITTWITGSQIYQTVAKYITDSIDTLTKPITASVRSILAKIKGGP